MSAFLHALALGGPVIVPGEFAGFVLTLNGDVLTLDGDVLTL